MLLIILSLTANLAAAAAIQGTVYDFSLKKISNAVVTINTVPEQSLVATDGKYGFEVPQGNYVLEASELAGTETISAAEKNVSVSAEGTYTIDLITFPVIEEEASSDIEVQPEAPGPNFTIIFAAVIVIAFILLAFAVVYLKKAKKTQTKAAAEAGLVVENEVEKVLKAIGEEGGRTTQKDLRHRLGMSEAKLSLIISELEHDGKIRKIKKGRGNIIIVNKGD